MAKMKQGDAVVIAEREATPQDVKSGLYYAHYAGLRGTILKLYGEEAAVLVDRETLPKEIRARHDEGEKAMRGKWLDNLSEVARSGLNEREKSFSLNYAVLVSINDLQPDKGQAKKAAEAPARGEKQDLKTIAHAARAIDPATGESDVNRADKKAEGDSESGTDSAVKRATAAELDAAEEEFLQQRAASAQSSSNGKGRKKA